MGEKLQNPGDVTCDVCTLTTHGGQTIDLKADPQNKQEGFIAEVNIYEDMWSKFVHGDITLRDAANLMESGPIVGGETITMKFRTNTFPGDMQHAIDRSFKVTGVYHRTLNNDREQIYMLKFISIEAYNDQTKIVGQRFTGKTHELILKIYDELIKVGRPGLPGQASDGLFIGDTPHVSKTNFVSNQWTPFQIFDWLTRYCQGNKNIGADFLFYESHKSFWFTSIQQRIDEQLAVPFEEYIYELPGSDIKHRASGSFRAKKIDKKHVTIDKFIIPRTMDTLDGQDQGYFAQEGRAYDLYSKERIKNDLDIVKDFDKFVHTETNCPVPDPIPREKRSKVSFKMLNMNNMAEANNVPGAAYGNNDLDNIPLNLLYRDNYFNSFKDYTFEIHVPGRTDIQVGDLIKVLYPSTKSKSKGATYDDIFDKKLTGNYLITAIRHKIDTGAHTMQMEVVKNGLPVSVI